MEESKSQSQGQDSQITSEDSTCLAENVQGFQDCVNEILNRLIELSRMHEALADQNGNLIKEVSKNTQQLTIPIKTEHADSSTSTTPQVIQTRTAPINVTLNPSGGGFSISERDEPVSSLTISTDSKLESFKYINKQAKSPVNTPDAPKAKETKGHDPKALLKKISSLEKEQVDLKKKIQNLTDENALLEADKANVADLKLTISESNRKIETMVDLLENSEQQVKRGENEIVKLKQELSKKVKYQTELVSKLESMEKILGLLNEKLDSQEARDDELKEQVKSGLADISKRHDEIKELKAEITLLKIAHSTEADSWNTDMGELKNGIREMCELADDLNQKHDALMSYSKELKLKLVESEREVVKEDAV